MISNTDNIKWPATLFTATEPEVQWLESLGLAFAVVDAVGTVRYWSEGAAELLGYRAGSLLGQPVHRIGLSAEDEAVAPALIEELLAGGGWSGEVAVLKASGAVARLEIRAVVLYDSDGGLAGVLATGTDVSNRVQAELRADELEAQLALAHRVGQLGSWEWDVATDRLATSSVLSELLEVPDGSPLSVADALAAMPPEDRRRVSDVLQRLRTEVAPVRVDFRIVAADGSVRHLEACAEAVRTEHGTLKTIRGTTADVTTRVLAAQRLREAGEFWQATLDSLTAHVAVLDEVGTIVAVNRSWRHFSISEGSGEAWIGASYIEVCERSEDPEGRSVAASLREMLAGKRDYLEVEYACHSPTKRRWFVLRATRHQGSGPVRVVVAHEEITSLRVAEENVSLHAALLDEIDAAVILTDRHKRILAWNSGAEQLYGWTREEAIGAWMPELLSPDGTELVPLPGAPETGQRIRTECVLRRKDGSTFPAHVRSCMIERSDEEPLYVGVSMDISERKAAEQALLSARNYLRAVTDHMGDGLYTLDADGRVTYMNQVAQQLLGWSLRELHGRRMHDVVRPTPVNGQASEDSCPICCARAGREPTRIEEDTFVCRDGRTLPVAYTVAPFETEDGAEGCVVVFQDITARKAEADRVRRDLEKLVWVGRIQDALRHDWFALYGQPIVDLQTGREVQRELLIRMCPPESAGIEPAVITPGSFLPVAEEYGFITQIDRWVVDRAAEIAAEGTAVELNISARSISEPWFTDHVREALTRTGADPALVVFEITETALIGNELTARRFVETLHEMGCGIALDDFGTGYGGFTYLKQLPIDSLKIDIEFVRDLRHNTASQNVVQAVTGLARGFGLKTVAEGVEDAATLDLLRSLGVDYAQGFHIGRPGPITLDRPTNH